MCDENIFLVVMGICIINGVGNMTKNNPTREEEYHLTPRTELSAFTKYEYLPQLQILINSIIAKLL